MRLFGEGGSDMAVSVGGRERSVGRGILGRWRCAGRGRGREGRGG